MVRARTAKARSRLHSATTGSTASGRSAGMFCGAARWRGILDSTPCPKPLRCLTLCAKARSQGEHREGQPPRLGSLIASLLCKQYPGEAPPPSVGGWGAGARVGRGQGNGLPHLAGAICLPACPPARPPADACTLQVVDAGLAQGELLKPPPSETPPSGPQMSKAASCQLAALLQWSCLTATLPYSWPALVPQSCLQRYVLCWRDWVSVGGSVGTVA